MGSVFEVVEKQATAAGLFLTAEKQNKSFLQELAFGKVNFMFWKLIKCFIENCKLQHDLTDNSLIT